jgi:hypothetical protein
MTSTAMTAALDTHNAISSNDLAYQYSVQHNDIDNMVMVLRAHGKDYSREAAALQIQVANSNTGAATMDINTLEQIIDVVEKQSFKYMTSYIKSECDYERGRHDAAQQIIAAIMDTIEFNQ